MSGYASPEYARALDEFGSPLELPRAGGWLLERPIPGSSLRDGMGCYPVFTCRNAAAVAEDLEALRTRLVSVVLVADPFLPWDDDQRRRTFDTVVPWKEHFIVERSRFKASAHHRYYARRALREIRVERCSSSSDLLPDWIRLYGELVQRRKLFGIRAFSRRSFQRQLEVPGIVAFRALHLGVTVAAHLWYEQADVAYSHLSAVSAEGYRRLASYALHQFAIEELSGGIRWLDLGGPAGSEGPDSGLAFFKRGWATGTRTAWLCGRILDPDRYRELAGTLPSGGYFPAYRDGELTAA